MRGATPLLLLLPLLCATACDHFGAPKQKPEEFATAAVRALTMNDWGAYVPLCSQPANRAAAGGSSGLGQRLAPMELEALRREFDLVVRSRRLRPHAIELYRTVVSASESDRWTLDVVDAMGNSVGIQLQVRRLGQSYEILHSSVY